MLKVEKVIKSYKSRKLIDDQVIKPNGYGYVSFLLPYFDKFVEQQMILEDL